MAADPVVEYWAEILAHAPVTPQVMTQWKRVLDHGIDAWSRALSEVMATEEFAQLLGTSIQQWLRTQASFTGNPASLSREGEELASLAADVRRLEDRLRQVEERIGSSTAPARSVQGSRQASRRRRVP